MSDFGDANWTLAADYLAEMEMKYGDDAQFDCNGVCLNEPEPWVDDEGYLLNECGKRY